MAPQPPSEDYTVRGSLKVRGATALPDLLDVFVAGGGPAGTAAAVRAREFGLTCLVVDYDDLMKRIRDYPKEKLIKPNYGGGDKLQFPRGGPMLAALQFDDVDKDELVAQWKERYRQCGINAKIGSELSGLSRLDDGTWEVRTWNHRVGSEVRYRARHVVIAMGAGVPRRFDIPGNTDGIAFRLDDPAHYVGAPALVIGGGTSAAEAVISISNAKTNAEDATPVYWSYRGDRLPKVSRALSEAFFDAYVGNGNIRYLAFSEPVAVVAGPDRCEYLSVRIDRKVVEGRPSETVHLEFPKQSVVACIGEDLPVRFLKQLGVKIPQVDLRPTMLVNQHGEVSLPGVFLVGDSRGPRYLRCTDFDDTSTYEQVTQRRNIKLAMVEAVAAIEAIGARLGKSAATVDLPAAATASPVPPLPVEAADARPAVHEVQLLSLHPDGTPDEPFPITKDTVRIGRAGMEISRPDDVYLADHHATIARHGDGYVVEDTGAGSGVWMRVRPRNGRALGVNDLVWVGAQILMILEEKGAWAAAHYNPDGVYQATFPIGERGLLVGRGSQAVLDPGDMSLSRRHAQLRLEGSILQAFDLGSRNGTFVKITCPEALANGDEFRIGNTLFRFETYAAVAKLEAGSIQEAAPQPAPNPTGAPLPAVDVATGAIPVVLEHAEYPVTFGAQPGTDLLHSYFDHLKVRFPGCKLAKSGEPSEHQDQPLGWECKVGLCGLCAIRIVEGADNFEPPEPSKGEMKTIANVAALDDNPRQHRLACLARIKGPVKITIPS
ncbi:MAG: FAD-dependent oxidoreductase [Deltaproteobacteria bacterium]|nr:FAD-dependent oxidoreductase [Deltaproteobacteria bacterium]